jgi:putative intracellular protease/amidase
MRWKLNAAISTLLVGLCLNSTVYAEDTKFTAVAQASGRLQLSQRGDRVRPLVVVVADNDGTETTDFLIPLAVLRDAGVADVVSAATHQGAISLMPALRAQADFSLEQFGRVHPEGADIIFVPAMHNAGNARILAWLSSQARRGATIVSICEGARLVAAAGLLEGRKATTHWYALKDLANTYPGTTWIRDRRYVVDGNVISTTGVTASLPVSLAVVEAIGGTEVAQRTAARLGVQDWAADHETKAFQMPLTMKLKAAANLLGFWSHETLGFQVTSGADDVALALTADAWSRTYRSKAVALNPAGYIVSSHGITFLTEPDTEADVSLDIPGAGVRSLDLAMMDIEERFGPLTAHFVAMQLEYLPQKLETQAGIADKVLPARK